MAINTPRQSWLTSADRCYSHGCSCCIQMGCVTLHHCEEYEKGKEVEEEMLTTNRKLYKRFRLVPKSVTLNNIK